MKNPTRRAEAANAPLPGRRRALASVLLLGAGWLPGCGGGEPGGADGRKQPAGGIDSGGTGKTYFRVGVQAVAPLAAGEVVFDTRGAAFVDADGAAFEEGSLAPGMSVDIDAGSVSQVDGRPGAVARTVHRSEQLIGAVQAVQAAAGSLQVWSQTVLVTTGTVFDPALGASWTLLAPGTQVRIWGQLDSARGHIVATRIDRPDPGGDGVVRGVLSFLERNSGVISIGTLFAAPAPGQPVSLPDGLAVGDIVRVRIAPGVGAAATLLGLRTDGIELPDREGATIDGRIGAMTSASRFEVDGVPVDATDAVFSGAGLPFPGARAAVAGSAAGGVLFARTVVVEADEIDEVAEVEGAIQSVDSGGARFVLRRTTVHWSESTRFEGGSPGALRPRRRVSVKGRRSAERGLIEAFYVHIED